MSRCHFAPEDGQHLSRPQSYVISSSSSSSQEQAAQGLPHLCTQALQDGMDPIWIVSCLQRWTLGRTVTRLSKKTVSTYCASGHCLGSLGCRCWPRWPREADAPPPRSLADPHSALACNDVAAAPPRPACTLTSADRETWVPRRAGAQRRGGRRQTARRESHGPQRPITHATAGARQPSSESREARQPIRPTRPVDGVPGRRQEPQGRSLLP